MILKNHFNNWLIIGIVDIQITPVARHNLMQVKFYLIKIFMDKWKKFIILIKIANILQTLAMSDDDKDLKVQDLYSKFRPVNIYYF